MLQMQKRQIFSNSQSILEIPSHQSHIHSMSCNSSFFAKSITHTQEYSWIDEYLNLEVPKMSSQPEQLQSGHRPLISLQVKKINETSGSEYLNVLQTSEKKNRSIFHNFQKHIITLLKRIVSLRRIELLNCPSGLRAYQFWKLFKISKDFTKKTLYMIFGVAQQENIKNLNKLGQHMPDLNKLLEKMSKQDIQATQSLLRQKIGAQIKAFQKEFIRHNCKMGKFQEFYSYFLNFTEELQNQGLSKRLRKQTKKILVKSSISSQTEQRQ